MISTLQSQAAVFKAAHSAQGEPNPSSLEPGEAEETVQEEYEPLMAGQDGATSDADDDEAAAQGEEADSRGSIRDVRKLEVHVSYAIFFILGACILLPWSSAIVASTYFRSRLEGTKLGESVTLWVAQVFTGGNLAFLALANATQQGAHLGRRISFSIILMMCILLLGLVSTLFESIPPALFFSCLLAGIFVLSGCASYLQNAVVALSSKFGPSYLQGILSGQGAIGLGTSLLQFFAALSVQSVLAANPFATATVPKSVRHSAFYFFVTITSFSAVALIAHRCILIRLRLFKLVDRSTGTASKLKQGQKGRASIRVVERKVRLHGFSVFYIFFISLSVFPSITATVYSVDPEKNWITKPELFIPLHFIVFNAGDWLGRALPQWHRLVWKNKKGLMYASLARTAFIPIILMCNIKTGGATESASAFISSDWAFMIILAVFACSNGYLSTLIMLAVVVDPVLEDNEIDIAATLVAYYLTLGLAMGSFFSFAVKASVCRCNPFI